MDEPLSNSDAKLRVETRANIASLQQRLETTTICAMHDRVEAMTVGIGWRCSPTACCSSARLLRSCTSARRTRSSPASSDPRDERSEPVAAG